MASPVLKGKEIEKKFIDSVAKLEMEILKKLSIIAVHEYISSRPEVSYIGCDPEGRKSCCTSTESVWNISGGSKPSLYYSRKNHEFSVECINLPEKTYRMNLTLLSKDGVELEGLPRRQTILIDIQTSTHFGKVDDKWIMIQADAFVKSCNSGLNSLFQFF